MSNIVARRASFLLLASSTAFLWGLGCSDAGPRGAMVPPFSTGPTSAEPALDTTTQDDGATAPGGAEAPDQVDVPGAGDSPSAEQPLGDGQTPISGDPGSEDPSSGAPGDTPVGEEPPAGNEVVPEDPGEPPPEPFLERPTRGTTNLFTELLGVPVGEVDQKLATAANRIFGIGTGESPIPQVESGYRVYYELPQNQNQAFMLTLDQNPPDIRSEGMSYGMMIALQMNMQTQFDRLWNFAKAFMQYPDNSNITAWRRYFSWRGRPNTQNPNNFQITYDTATDGPAPDGEEYFAAALYLADRRWGSSGAINYEQEADAITGAMLNNAAAGGRTPLFNQGANMVVFYPAGNSANFSDPSYHLPAFYEIFAQDGPAQSSNRWRQIAGISRQFFVSSAHPVTGLHPDYANFSGTPNTGGSNHDQFRYDAWRVVMNMAVDYAWGSNDARLRTQVEKYHGFFASRLEGDSVRNQTFALDGSNAGGRSSTALTSTLASGALATEGEARVRFVQNLWNVEQQSGRFRYYEETVYMLGLLATAGMYGYEWAP